MRDGSDTGNTVQQLATGISVVTADALAALALPDPIGDVATDWYYWTAAAAIMGAAAQTNPVEIDADIRTSRVLRGGYRLVLSTESPASNDVDTNVSLAIRALWVITS